MELRQERFWKTLRKNGYVLTVARKRSILFLSTEAIAGALHVDVPSADHHLASASSRLLSPPPFPVFVSLSKK